MESEKTRDIVKHSVVARGIVELVSTDFAIGWAPVSDGFESATLVATLDGRFIGSSSADIVRRDLEAVNSEGGIKGRAFVIVYNKRIEASDVDRVVVVSLSSGAELRLSSRLKREGGIPIRIFLLGSPRSGTSQLGETLVNCLKIGWTGEAHAGPRFAEAAEQLAGDPKSPVEFIRALSAWNFRRVAIDAARRGYFFMHSSSSFLDKTPGVEMIRVSPFMAECFRDAKFIFIMRHPVANIASRLARFGGNFEDHCKDWATTMSEWHRVSPLLPNFLELKQEDMASNPRSIATRLSEFLDRSDTLEALTESLSSGSRERTGAGQGKISLSHTDWSDTQKRSFLTICGNAMRKFNYDVEEISL